MTGVVGARINTVSFKGVRHNQILVVEKFKVSSCEGFLTTTKKKIIICQAVAPTRTQSGQCHRSTHCIQSDNRFYSNIRNILSSDISLMQSSSAGIFRSVKCEQQGFIASCYRFKKMRKNI